VPDFQNPFFGTLVSAFELLAEDSGYRLVRWSAARNHPGREIARIEAARLGVSQV